MKTSTITFKIESRLKRQLRKKAAAFEISVGAVLTTYINRFLRTTETDWNNSLEPSEYLKKIIAQSEEEIKRGDVISFNSLEEEQEFFANLIKKGRERRKRKKSLRKKAV